MIDADELRRNLGPNISRLRRDRDMSQQQLADLLGIHRVQVNRIENGHHVPNADLLFTIADAFGVPADTLRQVSLQKSSTST